MDQPLLHSRPQSQEELRALGGGTGDHRVHGQLEIGRRQHEGCDLGRLRPRAAGGDRSYPRTPGREGGARHRLLRGRHHAGRDAGAAGAAGGGGQGQERDLLHRPG